MRFSIQNTFTKKNIGNLELNHDDSWEFSCRDKKLDAYLRPRIDRAMREGFRDFGEAYLDEPVRFPDKAFLLRLEEELAFAGVLMKEEAASTKT